MYLPEEIVVDILSRLPVKSLLRFECVSKQWRSSISDHQFAKFQLSRSLSLAKTGHQKFLLSSSGYDEFYMMYNSENPCEKAEDEDLVNIEKLELHSLPFDYENPPDAFCSCDGLLLVGWYGQFHKYFFLWNPCLKACIQVQCPLGSRFMILGFGFCYDPFSNDYKAVIIFINYDVLWSSEFNKSLYIVFSVKSNRWTESKKFPFENSFISAGEVVNEALHWIVVGKNENLPPRWVILCLDMIQDKFKEVPCPYFDPPRTLHLAVLQECLCVFVFNYEFTDQLEIWTMKEYGVGESWTKLITIPAMEPAYITERTPLCFMRKGEVIMKIDDEELVIYNPDDDTYRTLMSFNYGFRCTTYVESLIIPWQLNWRAKDKHKRHKRPRRRIKMREKLKEN